MDNQKDAVDERSVRLLHEVTNYERISAFDGREDDLSEIISGRYPDAVSSGEVGCVTSHLKSIKHWYETTDTEYGIFMEDDCDFCSVKHWVHFLGESSCQECHMIGIVYR